MRMSGKVMPLSGRVGVSSAHRHLKYRREGAGDRDPGISSAGKGGLAMTLTCQLLAVC